METARVATNHLEMSNTVSLHCPFPSAVSPHADRVQCESVAWARRLALAATPGATAVLERASIGWLVARSVPAGAVDALQLAANWTTFFCLLDDHVEGLPVLDAADQLARLFKGFATATPDPSDRFALALEDLRVSMTDQCTPEWIENFQRLVHELFTNFILEAVHRASDRCPELDTYRAMREVTVGLHPEFALAELACGIALTPGERAHPLLRRMTSAAARSVGWANDLFTCVREAEAGEVHNLVVVLVTHGNCSPAEAAAKAAEIHDAEVREVEALQNELAGSGLRDEVMRYVGCVQSWIRGHMDWAAQTGRYGVLPVACAV